MSTKRQKRQTYTREYKIEAVRLSSAGTRSVAAVAADLGIRRDQLYQWRREFANAGIAAFPGNGRVNSADEELLRLRRDLKRVTEERDFLKKATVGSTGQRNKGDVRYRKVAHGSSRTTRLIVCTETRMGALATRRVHERYQ